MRDEMGRLLDAVLAVTEDLDLEVVLRRIVEAARELVGADYAALGVLNTDGDGLSQFIYSGIDAETAARIGDLPRGKGILGALIDQPDTLRLKRLADDARSTGFPPHHPPMRRFIGTPVRVREEVFGNLYLADNNDQAFTADDETLVVGFAGVAGVAIANARLVAENRHRQQELQRLRLVEERERIGRDLHDTVIQQLFATGLSLQAVGNLLDADTPAANQLEAAVDDIDKTIKQIRSLIFGLQTETSGLRTHMLSVIENSAASLPTSPRLQLNGPLDTALPNEVGVHLLAVLREAVTNVARHANATQVDIEVAATATDVQLTVRDDGEGGAMSHPGGFGIANMRSRAADCNGTFEIASDNGTTLRWSASW